MTRRSLAVIFLFLMLHLGFSYLLGTRQALRNQEERAAQLESDLEKIVPRLQTKKFFFFVSRLILKNALGKDPGDPRLKIFLAGLLREFPSNSLELGFFNSSGTYFDDGKPDSGSFLEMQKSVDYRWLQEFQIKPPPIQRIQFPGKPSRIGVWCADPTYSGKPGKITGILLVADKEKFNPGVYVKWLVWLYQHEGLNVGYCHRSNKSERVFPPGINQKIFTNLLRRFWQEHENSFWVKRDKVSIVPGGGNYFLLGKTSPESPVFPLWSLGLLVLWLPLAVRKTWSKGALGIPLQTFLSISLGLSAGIPLLVTFGFWINFEENRVASIISEEFREMQQELINLDNLLPTSRRKVRNTFQNTFQTFKPDQATLEGLKTHINDLELQCFFDNCFLISSQGVILRDYSHFDTNYRVFSVVDQSVKPLILKKIIESGRVPTSKEINLMLQLNYRTSSINDLWAFKKNKDDSQMRQVLSSIGKNLIDRDNQNRGQGEWNPEKKEDPTALVYGGLIESQGGDLYRRMLSTLGDFANVGTEGNAIQLYFDILRDAKSVGQYCTFLVANWLAIEQKFLREIFASPQMGSPGMAFYALCVQAGAFFPQTEPRFLFPLLPDSLTPPQRLLGKISTVKGEKALLAAFACQNLWDFLLVGTKSYKVVEEKQQALRRKMFGIGLLMCLLLAVISWRLGKGVLEPAKALLAGIGAMEKKTFTHRIPLLTGDEWDDLAMTFNNTLSGMEELEVAKLIQTKILPAGRVISGETYFLGRAVMTAQVGGDYYDAMALPEGGLAFIIGDVTGHGVSAALVVAMAKSAFNYLIRSGIRSPAAILQRLNGTFLSHLKIKGMTCQVGFLSNDGTLLFSNAGHPYPFVISPGKPVAMVSHPGLILGTSRKFKFVEKTHQIPPSSKIVLYTDGMVEAKRPDGELWGFSSLEKAVQASRGLEGEALIEELLTCLKNHTLTRPWDDDVSLAVIEVHPGPASGDD